MVTFNVKLTPEDCIKAHYFVLAKKYGARSGRQVVYGVVTYLSICLVILGAVAAINFKFFAPKIFPMIFPILLLSAIFVWNIFITAPRSIRRALSRNPTLLLERKIVVSPNRLETTSVDMSVDMKLSSCVRYESNSDLILLHCSEVGYDIFPRRCFKSDEDFQTVISYLEASLGSPKPRCWRDYF